MRWRLAIAAALVAVVLAGVGWVVHMRGALDKARAATAIAQAGRATAEAQGNVALDAAAITDAGATRDQRIVIIREANHDAIRTAPGSGAALDPDLVRAGRDGLCRYAAYSAEPECVALRPVHPAVLPAGGPAGPAATP